MFIREVVTGQKEGKPVRYAQIVESYREQGKSRHRILLSLGRVDEIDKKQIQNLIKSLSRYLENGELPEGCHIGDVREYGLIYLASALWQQLKLPAFFSKQLRKRKYETSVEKALMALVIHRLVEPGSKLSCEKWLKNKAYWSEKSISVQNLYRAMDFLEDCHKSLEEELYIHRRKLFDKANIVYYDTTSTYFDCDEISADEMDYGLRQRGYSRDLRPDRRQIVIGLATDHHGLPIASEVFSGDTNDTITVLPMLTRLRKMGLVNMMWVADRGMASDINMATMRAAGVDYILGARLRAQEDLRDAISQDKTEFVEAKEGLMVKEVRLEKRRYVVCFSPDSAQRDLNMRTRAIERMNSAIKDGDNDLIGNHGFYQRIASKNSDGRYILDKSKLEREAQCDGTFVLEVSNPSITPTEAALAYKNLLNVESSFRALKHSVDIRPVFHRLDKRIRAHVNLCVLAYLLERIVELGTKRSFEEIRALFTKVHAVELLFNKQTVWETSKIPKEIPEFLKLLNLQQIPQVLL